MVSDLVLTFPAEAIPDGNVMAPHHYTYGLLVAFVPILLVWDNKRRAEPWVELTGAGVGLFGFLLTWPLYPVVGSLLSAVGPLSALVAVVVAPCRDYVWTFDHWTKWPRRVLIVALLLALDDWLSHALGLWTPADWLWTVGLAPVMA